MILSEGPNPLYFQIKNIIKSKIFSHEIKEKECLPSEDKLSKVYNVSKGTIRQALSELVKDGLIYRVRGKGTFVTEEAGLRRLIFKSTIENLITTSREGRIKVLNYKEVMPPPHVANVFHLEMTQKVFQLEVVFSTFKGSSRYSFIYFPSNLGKMISRSDLKETTEIILLVEEKLQARIDQARQIIGVVLANKIVAKNLSIKRGTPIFVMKRYYIARGGSLIFMSVSYCRPDLFKLRIDLTRT